MDAAIALVRNHVEPFGRGGRVEQCLHCKEWVDHRNPLLHASLPDPKRADGRGWSCTGDSP